MGASILNTVLSGLSIIEGEFLPSSSLDRSLVDDIITSLEKYAQDRQTTSFRTGASFQAFLDQHLSGDSPLRILTLSSSYTIASAITHILGKALRPVHVHMLKSRPLFEGVGMVQAVASFANENKAILGTTVHTHTSVAVAARGVDIVLIGAELIDRTAVVSNKVSSLSTILTARCIAPQAKVIVLSEKEKVLPFSPLSLEVNEPQEVTQAWGELSASLLENPHRRVNIKTCIPSGCHLIDQSLYY